MINLAEFTYRSERDKKTLEAAINSRNVKAEDVEEVFKSIMGNAQAEIDTPLVLPSMTNQCGKCVAFNAQGLCWAIQCERTEKYKTVSKNALACPMFSAVSLWVNETASIREQQNE